MRVHWSNGTDSLSFHISLDPEESLFGDGQGARRIQLLTNTCRVKFASEIEMPSPDVLGLAAFVLVAPWVRHRIAFDQPVSSHFAEALACGFGVDAGPVDDRLERRTGRAIGLAYSGGADSIACSSLLPDDSPHVHFHRMPHRRVPNRATHLKADLQADLVRRASGLGKNIHVVQSDAEFMVGPFPMFPVWVSLALPAILAADSLDLGGLGFGTVMGSRYLSNGYRFKPPPSFDAWSSLFDSVGLPYVRPTAGMTEVGTLTISQASQLGSLSRSCLLGTSGGPCLNCSKCLRKELVVAAIEDRPVDGRLMENMVDSHPAVLDLRKPPPYYFQHIVEFALARARGIQGTFLEETWENLGRPNPERTDWATRFYRPALINDVPNQYRAEVTKRVEASLDYMSEADESVVETWDASSRVVR